MYKRYSMRYRVINPLQKSQTHPTKLTSFHVVQLPSKIIQTSPQLNKLSKFCSPFQKSKTLLTRYQVWLFATSFRLFSIISKQALMPCNPLQQSETLISTSKQASNFCNPLLSHNFMMQNSRAFSTLTYRFQIHKPASRSNMKKIGFLGILRLSRFYLTAAFQYNLAVVIWYFSWHVKNITSKKT